MKPADVRKHIASGETAPLYLLEGDDPQARHDLAVEFVSVVDEGLHAFNVQTYYANEATTSGARDQLVDGLLSAARTLPMMAPRRVLIVHRAEGLLSPRRAKDDEVEAVPAARPGSKRKRALTPTEELERYLEAPEALTTVVFVAGDLDANRRLVKLVRKHAAVVDCGTLDSPADAAAWVKARLGKERLTIEPRAMTLLIDGTGLSLGRLRAEIDKLVLFAAGESVITARHVRELIAPPNEPGKNFPLGTAIWGNDPRAALRELAAQFDSGAQAPMVLGQIRAAVGRLQPDARARRALDAVFQADLAIKSSAGEPRFLLERLLIELCTR
jgi:DNA polymerase III delta subunit